MAFTSLEELEEAAKLSQEEQAKVIAEHVPEVTVPEGKPTLGETFGAALMKTSWIAGMVGKSDIAPDVPLLGVPASVRAEHQLIQKGVPEAQRRAMGLQPLPEDAAINNPGEFIKALDGYEEHADTFIGLNDEQMRQQKEWIDYQRGFSKTLSESPWYYSAPSTLITAMFGNPENVIPVGAVKTTGSLLINAGRAVSGTTIAKEAGKAALKTAPVISFTESMLHETDPELSEEASMATIMAGSMLTGLLGGAYLTKVALTQKKSMGELLKFRDEQSKKLEGLYKSQGRRYPKLEADLDSQLNPTMKDLHLKRELNSIQGIPPEVAKAATSFIPLFRPPVIVHLTSDFPEMVRLGSDLYSHPLTLNKSMPGPNLPRKPSLEARLQAMDVDTINLQRDFRNIYARDHLEISAPDAPMYTSSKSSILSRLKKDKLTPDQFKMESHRAFLSDGRHKDKSVAKWARTVKKAIDSRHKKLEELGILNPELSARSLSRVFNVGAVRKDTVGLRKILIREFQRDDQFVTPELARAEADKAITQILSWGKNESAFTRGLRETNLDMIEEDMLARVSDKKLFKYLDHDLLQQSSRFMEQANRAIAMKEYLLSRGMNTVDDIKRVLAAEKEALITDLTKKGEIKKAEKLLKQFDRDIHVLNEGLDGLLGKPLPTTGIGSDPTFLRSLRAGIRGILLQNVALTSLPEFSAAALTLGPLKTLMAAFTPSLKSFRTVRMAKNDLKDIGIGLLHEQNNILKALTNPGGDIQPIMGGTEKAFNIFAESTNKLSGATTVTNIQERLAAYAFQSNLMRTLKKWEKTNTISKKDRTMLSTFGIGEKDFKEILKRFNKYGHEVDGAYAMRTHDWVNTTKSGRKGAQLKAKIDLATIEFTRNTIMRPGIGDVPVAFARSGVGKSLWMLRPYSSKAATSLMLRGLQKGVAQKDIGTAMGIMGLIALGAASGEIKRRIAGFDKGPETVEEFIYDGFTRSGLSGVVNQGMLNLGQAYTEGGYKLGKEIISTIGGAGVSTVWETVMMSEALADGELTEREIERMKAFMPYINIFYIKMMLEQLE